MPFLLNELYMSLLLCKQSIAFSDEAIGLLNFR